MGHRCISVCTNGNTNSDGVSYIDANAYAKCDCDAHCYTNANR